MIGKTISHYRISEKLGQGGMGVVYKAEDTKLRRTVALKFLAPGVLAGQKEKARFLREARAAAALHHPNICTVHEINETADQTYIVMAYLPGQNLKDRLDTSPLPASDALGVAVQVARGLEEAHEKGVVHRDIKCANIIVSERGQVTILDFGLAKAMEQTAVTKAGTALGTPAYMSPEQATGEPVDHRTDIWSLGVCLYEMLTGELPFKGAHDQAVVYNILHEEAPHLANEPAELGRVVGKLLAKRPDDRYQSAKDALVDLDGLKRRLQLDAAAADLPSKAMPSIAVLPFENMSADPEQDYFCDGMAEDIINDLAQIDGLRVAARTSAFAFKGRREDVREIGRKLGVQTLLEGSVRKAGKRLRITAQLVSVEDGYHMWSQRFDREMEDVFAIQDEIARSIVQALKVQLSQRERRALGRAGTRDIEAYDFFLRGLSYYHLRHRASLEHAIELFRRAIDKDPSYALAYAKIAHSYAEIYMYYRRTDANLECALEASRKALELDPELAAVHTARGLAVAQAERYDEAGEEFERAIALNPNDASTYYWYARMCRSQGNMEKATTLFEKARAVGGATFEAYVFLAAAYGALHRKTEQDAAEVRALRAVQTHLELTPDDSRAWYLGGGILVGRGEIDKGLAWVRKALAKEPEDIAVLYNSACVFSLAGRIEEALGYFDKAIDNGYASREWIDNDDDLDAIRDHPRFQAALEKLE